MLSNCIKDLLGFKELNVKSIKNFKNSVEVYATLPISEQVVLVVELLLIRFMTIIPKSIKDIPINFKPTNIFKNKTRYEYKNCSKSFYPKNQINYTH